MLARFPDAERIEVLSHQRIEVLSHQAIPGLHGNPWARHDERSSDVSKTSTPVAVPRVVTPSDRTACAQGFPL